MPLPDAEAWVKEHPRSFRWQYTLVHHETAHATMYAMYAVCACIVVCWPCVLDHLGLQLFPLHPSSELT